MAVLRLADLGLLPVQPGDRVDGIAVQPGFPLHVAAKLIDAPAQGRDALHGLGFLLGQLVTLHGQALQHGRGNGLFLAL